jgi:hypothetical protein
LVYNLLTPTGEITVPLSARTFRVFVISTFGDLHWERDALQKRVYPRLAALCAQHGTRFQAIDLRWGISQEAGLDQRVLPLCLAEIARCQRVSPRPNFIVLLGNRYGGRPARPSIEAKIFEPMLVALDDAASRDLLRTWYRLDANAIPPTYYLEPRRGAWMDWACWFSEEQRLRRAMERAVEAMDLRTEERRRFGASATEIEVLHGALEADDAQDHVFCFFRDLSEIAPGSMSHLLDLNERGEPDREARARLDELKHKLRKRLPHNVFEYQPNCCVVWSRKSPAHAHPRRKNLAARIAHKLQCRH